MCSFHLPKRESHKYQCPVAHLSTGITKNSLVHFHPVVLQPHLPRLPQAVSVAVAQAVFRTPSLSLRLLNLCQSSAPILFPEASILTVRFNEFLTKCTYSCSHNSKIRRISINSCSPLVPHCQQFLVLLLAPGSY